MFETEFYDWSAGRVHGNLRQHRTEAGRGVLCLGDSPSLKSLQNWRLGQDFFLLSSFNPFIFLLFFFPSLFSDLSTYSSDTLLSHQYFIHSQGEWLIVNICKTNLSSVFWYLCVTPYVTSGADTARDYYIINILLY